MNLIKKFIKTKIEFQIPKKKKILFIGENNVSLFEDQILSNNHSICRIDSLNIWIFLISIFNKYSKTLRINYYINYIKFTDPKIVITFLDNYHYFYLLKNFFEKKKFISIQNGWRGEIGDFFDKDILNNFKNLKADYILTFNDVIGKKYKENVDCNNLTIGSFRNNVFKIKKFTRENSIGFISSYLKREKDYFHFTKNSKISFKDYFLSDKYIVDFLSKYSFDNNLKFLIITRKDNNDEINYYSKNNQNLELLPKKNKYCSYEYIDDFKQVIGTDTSLGYESLFRGNRVGFFNIRKNFIYKFTDKKLDCHNFLWPSVMQKEGPFWTHEKEVKSMKRVVDFVVNSSDIEWEKAFNTINKENFIIHDHGNLILKNLLNKYLNV